MPELTIVDGAAKIRVFAEPAVLDGLDRPARTLAGRIAPNELILLGEPGTGRSSRPRSRRRSPPTVPPRSSSTTRTAGR